MSTNKTILSFSCILHVNFDNVYHWLACVYRQIPDGKNSVKILRYMESSTSRAQALQETDASTVAADYSRIGPSYESIDSSSSRRQQPVAAAGRRNVAGLQLVRLSERYEFQSHQLKVETVEMVTMVIHRITRFHGI